MSEPGNRARARPYRYLLGDTKTEAALILDKPERAWLDPKLDDAGRELALTAMLALRLLPLGFE